MALALFFVRLLNNPRIVAINNNLGKRTKLVKSPSPSASPALKAPAAMAGHAVTPLAVYGRQEVLEGAEVEGVAILEFPSFDEAKAWYNSPAYREAREHRFRCADYRAVIVESL